MSRVISWFSCGAASAYASYLALEKYKKVDIVYCRVVEEHPDNMRFLREFEEKIKQKITILVNVKYGGSIHNVFNQLGFIKNNYGASCTLHLKKNLRKEYEHPDDIQIFGYTFEEDVRMDNFIDANNHVNVDFILFKNQIYKKNCLDFILSLGIDLPVMYKLGYSNNNCRGCVKGGMGYWNAIRKDFPNEYKKMAVLERKLNYAINKDKKGSVYLDELEPDRGNFERDKPGDCGFTCE